MKFSSATSVLVNYPLQDAVEKCASLGLDGVDIWCGRPHLYRGDYSDRELVGVRQVLENAKMAAVALMPAFFRYPYSLSSPVPAIRADSVRYMEECIDHAAFFHAGHVLVVPTNALFGQTDSEARSVFVHSLEEALAYAQTRAVKLGVEVLHPKLCRYLCASEQAAELICEMDSPLLGAVLDTGHLNLSGEGFVHAADTLGGALLEVHVNDNDAREQQNAVPGDGTFDFEAMCRTLEEIGYRGYLTLELGWGYSFAPDDVFSEAVRRMRRLARA